MALPREPRQKMINVMYLVLTAILALNVSAEVINAFKVVDRSLMKSNENITNSNATLYKSLEAKMTEPQSMEKAKIWEPKAMKAQAYSAEMMTYIDSLKLALKKGADLTMKWDDVKKDSVQDYREDNLDASTRLFETKEQGEALRKRLEQYKVNMLSIDPTIKSQFESTFPVNTIPPVSQDGTKKDFTQSFFHMTPTVAALTMLSKFQNNIKNAESEIVTYCHNQIGAVEVHMDQVGILVGQNSNYLMPGQQLQITAGVGAYSSAAAPSISINGSAVPVSNGQGTYTSTVSGAGEHTVNVNVTFVDENKKTITKSVPVKYTVGTPGSAAVMLDKMNVFYIGVPNPVTISSGTGWDKTHVSITSGSLTPSGGPGKFIVNVGQGSKTTSINVNADGKNSSYDFRIKRIPDPIIKVGPNSGGRIQSVVFKNQSFARADLENFDFDARFNIVSATLYFSGANFPSVQQATISGGSLAGIQSQLAKCIPGTSVTFDNVKVQGPDGVVRSIPGPGFILY
ncbi:MAG: gliding motility protein GldM [Bacteroidota bacterium]|nr:gliding motility protein GldM [Bacteroidota bacterium]